MVWPFVSRRERLRREAADWIARLNGPVQETDQVEFERWYHSSPENAAAYERVALIFDTAGKARRLEAGKAPCPAGRAPVRSRSLGYALAAAAACGLLLAFVLLAAWTVAPISEERQQIASISTADDKDHRFLLVDGSEVLLSPGSRVEVALGRRERRLRLVRGEGRFLVAHEARPFIVMAEGTEVMARGTQFVVRVSAGRTTVSLIDGRVDVSHASVAEGGGARRVTRLEPGQQLVVGRADEPLAAREAGPPWAERPARAPQPEMLQFENTPLEVAVEQANRHGRPQVRLDRAVAGLRVTGAFRAGDTLAFAESVAAAFDLELERGSEAGLLLRRRSQPPSLR